MKDLYEILGVEKTATASEIKRQYRQLAKKYHPDLNPGDEEAEQTFKEINGAYEILSDPDKRQQYDRFGFSAFDGSGAGGQGGFDFSDIFGDIFDIFGGGFSSAGRSAYDRQRPRQGSDIQQTLHLTFEEAIFGVEKEIQYRKVVTCATCGGTGAKPGTGKTICPKCKGSGQVQYQRQTGFGTFIQTEICDMCQGSGEIIEEKCEVCQGSGKERKSVTLKVNIPAGVDTGSVMNLRGEGNVGEHGGPAGNLYLFIEVEDHEFFQRQGDDIYYQLPITFTEAALGTELEVPTLEGLDTFEIPAGTPTGTRFVLEGQGVQRVNRQGRGNLYFDVEVTVPRKLSKKQEKLLREFAEEMDEQPREKKKSFFEKIKEKFEE